MRGAGTGACVLVLAVAAGTPVQADPCPGEVLQRLSWSAPGAGPVLRLTRARDQDRTRTLATVEQPSITGPRYCVAGRVRYQGVAPGGYLELWSEFEGGRYFSRTMDAGGPTGKLLGSSDWRVFALPFDTGGHGPPRRLVFNLVLPGEGTVWIEQARLVQLAGAGGAAPGQWWSGAVGGMAGGVAGSLVGLLGALAGALLWSGRARAVVRAVALVMALAGAGALVTGAVALVDSQGLAVWLPLLLPGGISLITGATVLVVARRRFAELELRRMQALDAMP